MKSVVSIIIPCYNEQTTIRHLLKAIREQTYPSENLEIIIADGMSEEDTRDVIAAFASAHPEMKISIVEKEIEKYCDDFDLYIQVFPGLTGLWQGSGRSDLSYTERVWLDTHYVRNWSIWLDLVILVRTVWVVIPGIGAY